MSGADASGVQVMLSLGGSGFIFNPESKGELDEVVRFVVGMLRQGGVGVVSHWDGDTVPDDAVLETFDAVVIKSGTVLYMRGQEPRVADVPVGKGWMGRGVDWANHVLYGGGAANIVFMEAGTPGNFEWFAAEHMVFDTKSCPSELGQILIHLCKLRRLPSGAQTRFETVARGVFSRLSGQVEFDVYAFDPVRWV